MRNFQILFSLVVLASVVLMALTLLGHWSLATP